MQISQADYSTMQETTEQGSSRMNNDGHVVLKLKKKIVRLPSRLKSQTYRLNQPTELDMQFIKDREK